MPLKRHFEAMIMSVCGETPMRFASCVWQPLGEDQDRADKTWIIILTEGPLRFLVALYSLRQELG